jgi:hypothetical protein
MCQRPEPSNLLEPAETVALACHENYSSPASRTAAQVSPKPVYAYAIGNTVEAGLLQPGRVSYPLVDIGDNAATPVTIFKSREQAETTGHGISFNRSSATGFPIRQQLRSAKSWHTWISGRDSL